MERGTSKYVWKGHNMSNHFDIAFLRRYVNGELSSSEMYAIEKASHQDEMLMDIIMGLEEEQRLQSRLNPTELHAAIYERTHPEKIKTLLPYKALGIAASLLLVLGIGTIWYLNRPQDETELAMAPADIAETAPTDTTLNSIELDSFEEDSTSNLIAAAPELNESKAQQSTARTAERASSREETRKKDLVISPDLFIDTVQVISGKMLAKRSPANNPNVISLQGKVSGISVAPQAEMSARVGSPQDYKRIITGEVIDQDSGYPIPQATVRNVKTNEVVMTDSSGSFVMPSAIESTELEILSIGYQSARILASNQQTIRLAPDYATLDEVVVIDAGKNQSKIKSEPLIGWKAYKKYINDHSKESLFGKGNVTLVFEINNFGRPTNIIVLKSANPSLDQQAIQIIKNGPDWKKGNDGKRIEVKIEFRQ